MPLTFLAHQAPVLPLKIAAPRWLDGTALVIGSMAPDLAFVLHGTAWYVDAHQLVAQFLFCLPLTLALTRIVKRVIAQPLASILPNDGDFRLREYGRLASWRPPTTLAGWLVLMSSALIGSYSHLVLDAFTHTWGWVAQRVPVLQDVAFDLPPSMGGRPIFIVDLLQLGATLLGTVATIRCLRHIGRNGLIADWCNDVPPLHPTGASRRALGGGVVVGFMGGLIGAAISRHTGGLQDTIVRVAASTFIGLTAGCVLARRRMEAVIADAGADDEHGRTPISDGASMDR
jgi:hypothetical protein